MNLKTATGRFAGDRDLLQEMLDEFLKHSRKQLEILDEAVTKGDTNLVEQEAHGLKDAAGNLGAKHVADIAHRLDVSARSRELTLAEQMIASLRNGLKQLEEYISGSPTDDFVGRSWYYEVQSAGLKNENPGRRG